MSAKGGREPKSFRIGAKVVFYLPLFVLKYQPHIPEGAKRTYHDGQRLHRLSEMTISTGITIFEHEFPFYKEHLSQLGCKKIRAEQMTAELPLYCPKCMKPDGHPHMRFYGKVHSDRDKGINTFDLNQIGMAAKTKYEVYYNHSKPKLSQCHIGYWNHGGYNLANGIDLKRCLRFTL